MSQFKSEPFTDHSMPGSSKFLIHCFFDHLCCMLKENNYKMSCVARKPVFQVSDQSDTHQAVQPQKMARDWKFRICTIYVAKTKALISRAVTGLRLCFRMCAFVFACAKSRFLMTGSDYKNIAKSEQSSHTPGSSHQRQYHFNKKERKMDK